VTNLEHARQIFIDATELLNKYQAPRDICVAVGLLGLLIEENRELRKNRDALSDTANYSLPGGTRQ
jgi:hypothetical protein